MGFRVTPVRIPDRAPGRGREPRQVLSHPDRPADRLCREASWDPRAWQEHRHQLSTATGTVTTHSPARPRFKPLEGHLPKGRGPAPQNAPSPPKEMQASM